MSGDLRVYGGLADPRNGSVLAALFASRGLRVQLSQAGALRVWFGERLYEFERSQGEWILSDPLIESATSLEADLEVLTHALEACSIRCRFEVYEGDALCAYRHVRWPQEVRA